MTPAQRIAAALAAATLAATLTAVIAASDTAAGQHGANPELPPPERGLLPDMRIAEPAGWGGRVPTVPQGWTIKAIATDLKIPRQTLVLPNGDILVAEGKGGNAPVLRPKDYIAGLIKAKGTSSVKSGNRLTLLRDADGDGTYEGRWVYAENLNAPYGLAQPGCAGALRPRGRPDPRRRGARDGGQAPVGDQPPLDQGPRGGP
jgi:glucose/arabinose dehydrogenase